MKQKSRMSIVPMTSTSARKMMRTLGQRCTATRCAAERVNKLLSGHFQVVIAGREPR
jgi:hypothetical protein